MVGKDKPSLLQLIAQVLDEGLRGQALFSRLQELSGQPQNEESVSTMTSRLLAAGSALVGLPCTGAKHSQALRLLAEGHTPDAVAIAVSMPSKRVSILAHYLSSARNSLPARRWVQLCTAGRTKRPVRRTNKGQRSGPKGVVVWADLAKGRGTRASTARRRSLMSQWEAVYLAQQQGVRGTKAVQKAVAEILGRDVALSQIRTHLTTLGMASRFLEGRYDDTKFSKIAQELWADAGNAEAAKAHGCGAPYVAHVRTVVRRLAAERLAVDPTFHLQPSQERSRKGLRMVPVA